MEADAFTRGRVKRELARAAWEAGLEIDFDEQRGLLGSVCRVTVSGDAERVSAYATAVKNWRP